MIKTDFQARHEIVKYHRPFAINWSKYTIRYEPFEPLPVVYIDSEVRDGVCGRWLFADLPRRYLMLLGEEAKRRNDLGL